METLHIVVMGVSGCGKSKFGARLAQALGLPRIEGDDFHDPASRTKMASGFALLDADRAGWLQRLGAELQRHPHGAVLSCSALKTSYRDKLRAAAPGLRFVHMAISQAESLRRVAKRAGHFYPPSLVASQFEALQDPRDECRVLVLDGTASAEALLSQALDWVDATAAQRASPGQTGAQNR